ncbi:hypothetical protein GCM10022248_80320 [Nonomuraea soli]
MAMFTDFVLRHKLAIVLAWLALAVAGGFAVTGLEERMTMDFGAPGHPAYETNREIADRYGIRGTPVVVKEGQQVEHLGRVIDADGYRLLYPHDDDNVPDGATGLEPLEPEGGGEGLSLAVELAIGAGGALVVLAFVFGSLLALVPLVVAAVAILVSFLAVYGLTTVTEVSMFVQFIIGLVGLGVAIDYSLLLITRWREENHDVRRAMASAGRAVVLSAATVAIGLIAMVVLPVAFLRSVGVGGMLIPLIAMLAVVTLLPILLDTVGPRLDRRRRDPVGRRWAAWAGGVVRHRWIALTGSAALLLALGAGALGLKLGEPASDALAKSGPAYEALAELRQDGMPAGALVPVQVLGPDPAPFRAIEGVHTAFSPAPGLITVIPETEDPAIVKRIVAQAPQDTRVGGPLAADLEFNDVVYGNLPLMLGLIMLITFCVLARAFRSIVLAAKAIVLNLLSLAAAIGATVLIWQQGYGSAMIWGIDGLGAIDNFLPLLIFAFLYGLTMDYEVFILARMREEYDRTGSTTAAVTEGLGRTGRLVTSAALVLFLAFLSLAAAPILQVKLFATALGIGILLDATVIRALLMPAMVAVMGRWNWWWPFGRGRQSPGADQARSSALGSPHQPSGVSRSDSSTTPR